MIQKNNLEQLYNSENLDRGQLITESSNSNSLNLDDLSTSQIVDLFIEEDLRPQEAVYKARKSISFAISKIVEKIKRGGRLFYIGAGTSGRLGILDAAECPPTFCSSPELIQGVLAGGPSSMFVSSETLEDDTEQGQIDLEERGFNSQDSLIGITAGGTTPYVIGALKFAKELNALSVAIACVPESQATLPCDIDIRIITGPELLSGSTRLKAGTATKMTLNIISTSIMIKLGKVYKNRMVDLSVSNTKLLDRAIRIVSDFTDLTREDTFNLLQQSDGSVKLAILMNSCNLTKQEAKERLRQCDNYLGKAIHF